MTDQTDVGWTDDEVAKAVGTNPLWYHTMELRPGIVTPGWFDLRPIVGSFPWPDVRGKRCLDIGTYDGFLAFEMERRGASEVIATDIGGHENWDWPPRLRARGLDFMEEFAGPKGLGFEIATKALKSRVQKKVINIYDLSPETVGTFDVVVCGSLLLHLRDPFRALEAIRSVCTGELLSTEQIELELTALHPRTPVTSVAHIPDVQWHVANLAGHRAMITGAGFDIIRTIRPYCDPFGPGHPPPSTSAWRRALCKAMTGRYGVPHSAVLARPFRTT